MTSQASTQFQSHTDINRIEERRLVVALVVFTLLQAASSCFVAAHVPYWMDEILSVWASRLPSFGAIYAALAHGSEFAPPTFPFLLHVLSRLAGSSHLVLRLPSIVAAFVAAWCSFVLIRRYLGLHRAALGYCLVLAGLQQFALQARPYALVTACMALTLLLWDDYNHRNSPWQLVGIAALLALAISLHFYAVLLVPCMGGIELIYVYSSRRIRPGVWFALVAGGASIFCWLPLIHVMSRYNAGDANSPEFYGHPSLTALVGAFSKLFMNGTAFILLTFVIMLGVAAGRLLGEDFDQPEPKNEQEASYWSIVLGMIIFPLIVFLFARLVTKTFQERYVISSVIGMTALICGCIRSNRFFRRMVPLTVVFAGVLSFGTIFHFAAMNSSKKIISALPGSCPIVIADGVQWFPMLEELPPTTRSRIVYLTLPRSVPLGDPTNEHQIERWKAIDPRLPVEDIDRFLQQNSRFYVVDSQTSDDTQTQYLVQQHDVQLMDKTGTTLVFKSTAKDESEHR